MKKPSTGTSLRRPVEKLTKTAMKPSVFITSLAWVFTACTHHAQLPATFTQTAAEAHIAPDYTQVVIPCNIAPLNFAVEGDSIDQCVASLSYPGGTIVAGQGRQVIFDVQEWHQMLEASAGQDVQVQLYTHTDQGWRQHPVYTMTVSADSIDPYIAYRLIPPHNTFEKMSLCYRNLETAEETVFYNNQMLDDPKGGHCVNCHSFQNYRTQRMQFHVRQEFGGTMVLCDGQLQKYNLQLPTTISSGVYPSWHPTRKLIAYSVNKSFVEFHTIGPAKQEVQDSQCGLILFDVEHERVLPICDEPDLFESFPTWSPDGEWFYYGSAGFEYQIADATDLDQRIKRQTESNSRYKEIKYDVFRRRFNADDLTFSEPELVLNASADSLSATFPRISPDGRYLLTSLGDHGCFHIYHEESDLYVTDLSRLNADTLQRSVADCTYPLTAANSDSSEGYHGWSSNGRWIVFQSRRRDNNYARLYFCYFDREGRAHKAFELPDPNPEQEALRLFAYNVPEFIVEPVRTLPEQWARAIYSQSAKNAK